MWDFFIAFLFGVVEGITEWLPISSTGHMILLNEIFKLNVSEEFFDLYLVVIQLGAILAVIILFWKDIWPFGVKNNKYPVADSGIGKYIKRDKFQLWFKIVVACIPAAIVGVLFDDVFEKYFYNYVCVAIALIVFGIAFIVIENVIKDKEFRVKSVSKITYKDALIIGLFQLLAAIFPGTSRSGSTIIGALTIGVMREVAAKFTFFLAIPVMLGASLLKVLKFEGSCTGREIALLMVGTITAFVVSFVVIKWLIGYIKKHDFKAFGIYRIVLGVVVLIAGFAGVIGA